MKFLCRFLVFACVAALGATPSLALDPARDIGQYKHTRWTVEDGAPSSISTLAQGKDGFLWIGSAGGLYRFDGLSFEKILPLQPKPLGAWVSALLVGRDGSVWVGYSEGGTAVYRDGVLRDVPMPNSNYIMDLVQTPDGSVWATLGRGVRNLFRFHDGKWSEVGSQMGLPDSHLVKMISSHDGSIWLTTTNAVFRLPSGSTRLVRTNMVPSGHAAVTEDRQGTIWLSDAKGTSAISPGSGVPSSFYPSPSPRRKTVTIADRDGNIWGIADEGIFRVRTPSPAGPKTAATAAGAVTLYRKSDGLTSNNTRVIFEDRERNIWVGTATGLDRFRPANVVVEPTLTNFAKWGDVLLAASDGSVYIGEADAIYRVEPHGNPQVVLKTTEPQAICEGPDKAIWFVLQNEVVRLSQSKITHMPGPGPTDQGISDCAVDRHGQIWLAALRDGIFRRIGNRWVQIMVPPKQGGYPPAVLQRRRDQELMIGFEENSLAVVDPPSPLRMLIGQSLGHEKIKAMLEVPNGLLVGGDFGLGLLRNGHIRVLPAARYPELASIAGIAQTPQGETWLASAAGLVRIPAASLKRTFDDRQKLDGTTVLDFRDGLLGLPGRDAQKAAVAGADGRVWFSLSSGTMWVEPGHIVRNMVAPAVVVTALSADGKRYRDPAGLSLKAGASRLQIDFAIPSLTMPERVQVRYKLEGVDGDWVDPGERRQAFYTNLAPGHYAFRVIAANNDGVWNRTGATLAFDIPPTFLQSGWFIAVCTVGAGLLLWVAYRLRLRQLTARLRHRLEERLAERERIARDLHDTLLQGFQGLILRFQAVANELPDSELARASLGRALDSADKVLSEGRNSVKLLRITDDIDIIQRLTATAERMRDAYPVEFKMVVEGTPRRLHPFVGNEMGRIGDEAIINAFQHGKASRIDVVLTFAATGLTLGVRDDGIGIDPRIVARGGRQDHFGLVGMQERAHEIDAAFELLSRPGAGTEILLSVPARIAYVPLHRRGWRDWLNFTNWASEGL